MTKKKSTDGEVTFYPGSHKYKLGKRELTSCTQFLKDYFQPFDENKIAKLCAMGAKRRGEKGKGVRFWKREWKLARDRGTRCHYLMEQYLYDMEGEPNTLHDTEKYDTVELEKFGHGSTWIDEYYEKYGDKIIHVIPEYIVYDEELGIAGQVDMLVTREDDEGNVVIDVIDWKFTKKIEWARNGKAKDPISHLNDCNGIKYTLQLSTYAYILEKQGRVLGDLILPHITEEKCKAYGIEYRREEVERLIKWSQL
jgi:hypothetical protein